MHLQVLCYVWACYSKFLRLKRMAQGLPQNLVPLRKPASGVLQFLQRRVDHSAPSLHLREQYIPRTPLTVYLYGPHSTPSTITAIISLLQRLQCSCGAVLIGNPLR